MSGAPPTIGAAPCWRVWTNSLAEQRTGRFAARHAVGEVNIAPERDRGGAVILGHAISGMDLHAGEVGAGPVAEPARLGAVERPVGLSRACEGLAVGREQQLAAPGRLGVVGPWI